MNLMRPGAQRRPEIFRKVLLAMVLGAALPATLPAVGLATASAADNSAIPAATLTEVVVPGTVPMGAAAVDLGKVGYTEREFYADGAANRYRGALPGALATARLVDSNWPYRTRVLVRAPKPDKFNGTLVVEWANVTAGQDVDFAFAEAHDYLTREGYAVAVVSAQKVGVDRLKTWSPKRYGSLSVDASSLDPADGSKLDDCPGVPACPGDPLSWDIMTQVSKALKDNGGDNQPLPGLKVNKVIALGESQSAMRLTVYYDAIQPIHNFFDGFVFFDLAGPLRTDQPVPGISVNSESTARFFQFTNASRYLRTWAVAGASHSSLYGSAYVDAMVLRDKSLQGPDGPISFSQMLGSMDCDFTPNFSTVDHGLVLDKALDVVNTWSDAGEAAAPSALFERDSSGNLKRDADGNVVGGIRLAQFTAPTADIVPNGKTIFCVLGGRHRDFTAAELKARYGTHEQYVAQVRAAMTSAEEQGYILPDDRDAAIRAAEGSNVAR